jgi:uncharacterized protein YukE
MQENEVTMDRSVVELLQLLNGNGMQQAARNVEDAARYVDSLTEKLNEMITQVEELRRELKTYNDARSKSLGDRAAEVKDKMMKAAKERLDGASKRLESMKKTLTKAKTDFIAAVRGAVDAIKSRGRQGLNKLVEVAHLRQALAKMKAGVDREILKTDAFISRLTILANDLREAGEMRENAVRRFHGKKTKSLEHERDALAGVITSAPWKAQRKAYAGIQAILAGGIRKMEALEEEVKRQEKKRRGADEEKPGEERERDEAKPEKDAERNESMANAERRIEGHPDHDHSYGSKEGRPRGEDRENEPSNAYDPLRTVVAEPKQEYAYNSEAFEAYAKKEGIDEKAAHEQKTPARDVKAVRAR